MPQNPEAIKSISNKSDYVNIFKKLARQKHHNQKTNEELGENTPTTQTMGKRLISLHVKNSKIEVTKGPKMIEL